MDLVTDLEADMVAWAPRKRDHVFSCCTREKPKVHHGFCKAFRVAVPDIDRVLLTLLATMEPKRLIITGHSLGGAIATLAFAYLLSKIDFARSSHTIHLVTLGAPRCGNASFVAGVEKRAAVLMQSGKCSMNRFVHEDDIVPTVPPEHFGYVHTSGLHRVRLNARTGKYWEVMGDDATATSGFSLADHKAANYVRAIDDFALYHVEERQRSKN
jgi:predicted lipase